MAEDVVLYAITAGLAVLAVVAGLAGRRVERRSERRRRDERLTAALMCLQSHQSAAGVRNAG